MTITRALIVVALVLAMAGIQQTAIGFGQENEERLSRSTLGIPQMGDATYRVYDVKPMFHNKTGEPIYWVTAGVLQPSALGDIEPNKVELEWCAARLKFGARASRHTIQAQRDSRRMECGQLTARETL